MNDVTVIIPTWNSQDILPICLASLKAFSPQAKAVVVDRSDLTNDGCLVLAEKYGASYLDRREGPPNTRERYCEIVNAAASVVSTPWIVVAQDDVVFTQQSLDYLREDYKIVEKQGFKPGLLGARSVNVSGLQADLSNMGMIVACWRIVPTAMLVQKALFDELGGFDESSPVGMYVDDDFSYRAVHLGYVNAVSRAYVHHFGSVSYNRARRSFHLDMNLGKTWMINKHGDWIAKANAIQQGWRVP